MWEWHQLQGTGWTTYIAFFCGRVVAYESGPISYPLWPNLDEHFIPLRDGRLGANGQHQTAQELYGPR